MLNSICEGCNRLGVDCSGTENKVWTGCTNRQTGLRVEKGMELWATMPRVGDGAATKLKVVSILPPVLGSKQILCNQEECSDQVVLWERQYGKTWFFNQEDAETAAEKSA